MLSREMHESYNIENSMMSTDHHHVNVRPLFKQPRVEMPQSRVLHPSNGHRSSFDYSKELFSAIKMPPFSTKMDLNAKFVQLLTNQYSMDKIVIVSVWGPLKSGKSFLIDSMLSLVEEKPVRVFSKADNEGVNCWMRRIDTNDGNPLLVLDWRGFKDSDGESGSDALLLMYLVSSTIVYSYNCLDLRSENTFLELCNKMSLKLASDQMQYSLPQLVLCRRDVNITNNKQTPFIETLNHMQIFQPNISIAYAPYPAALSIAASEILDAPTITLDKGYIKVCAQLLDRLRESKPKYINDNIVNSTVLSILLASYTSMINRHHRVLVDKGWEDVLEALAVNAYNCYVTAYTESLEREFKDEKSLNKYQLSKKLGHVKTQAHLKLQNFTNIKGEPIFQKYKDKLREFVNAKEAMVVSINAAKAKILNSKYLEEARGSYLRPDQPLKEQNLYSYVSSLAQTPLEESRSDLIASNVRKLMSNQLTKVGNKTDVPKMQAEISNLSQKIGNLSEQLNRQTSKVETLQDKLRDVQENSKRSQLNVFERQQTLERMTTQNRIKDEERTRLMSAQERQSEKRLLQTKTQLSRVVQNQQAQLNALRSNLKQTISKLSAQQSQLGAESLERQRMIKQASKKVSVLEKNAQEKRSEVERLKELLAKPIKKKGGTCGCFG